MADHAASIRVSLKGDPKGIRDLEAEAGKAASGMQRSLSSALSTGLKGGTDALKSTLGSIKGILAGVGGIAGGLGMAEMIKGGFEAAEQYRALAFQIKAGSGELVDFRDLQKETHDAALKTGQASDDMAKAMGRVREKTGDADFARKTIEDIGTAATGSHTSLETMSTLAGTLGEKFGIGKEGIGEALATVVSLGNKGGVTVGELTEKMDLLGAFAKEAGLQGTDGLATMVGMLHMAKDASGSMRKGMSDLNGLLEQLGTTAGKAKIGAALGLSSKDMTGNAQQQIEAIMKATGGKKANLEKAFGGEQLKFMVGLGQTYGAALSTTTGDTKTKAAAGVDAIRAAFMAASKSSLTFADLQKEAADELQTGPKKIRTSIEKLRQAFESDKVQAAIGKFADVMPGLADVITKLVGFTAEHPILAGGAALGGVFGKGMIGSLIGSVMKGGAGEKAAGALTGGGCGGCGEALGASAGGPIAKAMEGAAGGWKQAAALAFGPIGIAIAAGIGLALVAAIAEAKDLTKKREAEAADAQRMMKGGKGPLGGAYQAAGALQNATGVDIDPNTAISEATTGQATSGQEAHDAAMAQRYLAKGARGAADMRLGNKIAQNHPEWFQTGTDATGTSVAPLPGMAPIGTPGASGGTSGSNAPAVDPAMLANALRGSFPQEQRVYVANAKDIGGSNGPTGGGVTLPGWKPR